MYEILVTTGYGSGGSTDSIVHFTITGDESKTDIREMKDFQERHITPFRNGATDSFIMTTKQCVFVKIFGVTVFLKIEIFVENSNFKNKNLIV